MRRTGVIADDFTGATDVASAYVARGHRAVVVTDIAAVPTVAAEVAVVVAALKTRTAPVADAVADSLHALAALQAIGAERFVFKYCSTFDSSDTGNIGPVLDALADALGTELVSVVPAFPDNGRTVYQGHLFVHDQLLEHSSMRHHPLTPMTRSRIAEILMPQTTSTVGEVHLAAVRSDEDLARTVRGTGNRFVVIDAIDDDDLVRIAQAVESHVLVSGAAGVALGAPLGTADPVDAVRRPGGGRLVLCGSASARTREQIAHAADAGVPTRRIDVARAVSDPEAVVAETTAWLTETMRSLAGCEGDVPAAPVVYTVGDAGDVAGQELADGIERVLAALARDAVDRLGVRSVIVAGGETSGAVVGGLGVSRLDIGPAIAPGVCWSGARTSSGASVALALKSGNFGAVDMFVTAWEALS